MNYSSRTDRIITALGCTNAVLARFCGIDPSLVSRFRTGARRPRPGSAHFQLFCGGIASYAKENGSWDTLRRACQLSEELGAEDAVSEYLTQDSPDTFRRDTSARTVYDSENMFGVKLSSLMNMLDISNIRLSRALNVDSSLISRFRNGLRVPQKSGQLMSSLCLYLHKVIRSRGADAQADKLALLTGVSPELGEEEFAARMSGWLTDGGEVQNTGAMDSFLERLDSMGPAKGPDIPAALPVFTEAVSGEKYLGVTGIQNAVVRFLGAVISSRAEEMKLYSDQNLRWMTSDPAFILKWRALMYGALKNRTRIKIIHNVDRSLPEMLAGIEKWLPLYMSGGVEGYYSRQAAGDRFSHTLFVCPGIASVSAFMAAGGEDKAEYLYTDEEERLSVSDRNFDLLLEGSKPLLQVYKGGSAGEYELFLSELASVQGTIKRLMLSPPAYALPAALLERMLIRSGADKDEREKILTAHAKLSGRFIDRFRGVSITDYLHFPEREDIISGRVVLNLSDVMSERILTYTMDDYREHIRALLPLLDGGGYGVVPLPESPFSNIQITVKEGFGAVVQKTDPPATVFRFGHPLMCKALSEYIDVIGQSGKSNSGDKTGIADFLSDRYSL